MKLEKTILTTAEAAAVLSCSTQTIYHLIHTRSLGAYKDVGGRPWRIPDYSIKDYIASRMNNTASMK